LVDLTKDSSVRKYIEGIYGNVNFSIYTLYNDQVAFFNGMVTSTIDDFYDASRREYSVVNDNMLTMIKEFNNSFDILVPDSFKSDWVHNKIKDVMSELKQYTTDDISRVGYMVGDLLTSAVNSIPSSVKTTLMLQLFTTKDNKHGDAVQIIRMCKELKYGKLKHIEELFEFQEWAYKSRLIDYSIYDYNNYIGLAKEIADNFFIQTMYGDLDKPYEILDKIPHIFMLKDFINKSHDAEFGEQAYWQSIIQILLKMTSLKKSTIYKYCKKY
jgi:hypothetical protein